MFLNVEVCLHFLIFMPSQSLGLAVFLSVLPISACFLSLSFTVLNKKLFPPNLVFSFCLTYFTMLRRREEKLFWGTKTHIFIQYLRTIPATLVKTSVYLLELRREEGRFALMVSSKIKDHTDLPQLIFPQILGIFSISSPMSRCFLLCACCNEKHTKLESDSSCCSFLKTFFFWHKAYKAVERKRKFVLLPYNLE